MIHETRNVAAETAWEMAARARAHALANRWKVAVAVTDAHGAVLAALRMDGVTPPILEFATDKAFTAATMRRATLAFAERMNAAPELRIGLGNRSRLLTWGGGLPLVLDGEVVGGIGVSGAAQDEDIACAMAALEALGFSASL